ncbi:MAG: tRNA pseudouridine(55) synthase TruB [Mycobacteriales bacterium]
MSRAGLLVVDKPAGWTSHDVVARVRKLAGTRRVGHAGTLDPMATGVLLVGLEQATRLLGHLAAQDKRYDATICLGVTTSSDDAEGEVIDERDATALTDDAIVAALDAQRGRLSQVPPAVSAVKVDGVRSYRKAREGKTVDLAPRDVTVHELMELAVRRNATTVELDVSVHCSTGTYIRAIARDVGAALGVGGHLTALRRTALGQYDVTRARPLDDIDVDRDLIPLNAAAAAAFARWDVDDELAARIRTGAKLPAQGLPPGPVAAFDCDGALLALVTDDPDADRLRYLAVFSPTRP